MINNWIFLHYLGAAFIVLSYPLGVVMFRIFQIALKAQVKTNGYNMLSSEKIKQRHFIVMSIVCGVTYYVAAEVIVANKQKRNTITEEKSKGVSN